MGDRLPSESEWEYACRAGARHTFCGSDNVDRVAVWQCGSVAVYGRMNGDRTLMVGGLTANDWGIYDMSGNFLEWTQDCWNENYAGAPRDGTARTTGSCHMRAQRGSAWNVNPSSVRAAFRFWDDASFAGAISGFAQSGRCPKSQLAYQERPLY